MKMVGNHSRLLTPEERKQLEEEVRILHEEFQQLIKERWDRPTYMDRRIARGLPVPAYYKEKPNAD